VLPLIESGPNAKEKFFRVIYSTLNYNCFHWQKKVTWTFSAN